MHGKVSHWLMDMARSDNWAIPGLTAIVLFAVLITLGIAGTTRLTTNSQIVLSCSLLAFAIYLRRHRGQVVALAIVSMSVLLALRYFVWRIDATLPGYWSVSLALGLALILAEAFAWLRTGLAYVGQLWPVEQPGVALPKDAVQWPTIDIFVIVAGPNTVKSPDFIDGLRAMNWPANKFRVTVLTTQSTPQLAEACDKARVDVRIFEECESSDYSALVNRALYESEAELVLIADCQAIIPQDLLIKSVGWFIQEPKLALAHSPLSFAAPAPSALAIHHLGTNSGSENWAIARRAALLEIGGLTTATLNNHNHTSLHLQRRGYFTAYLRTTARDAHHIECTRIDEPFKKASLSLRLRLSELKNVLDFYCPTAIGIFYFVPLAAICWGATPIVADFSTLAAYWLPQWILGRLALATALEHHRLRWGDFVQEELSGFAVLIRTTKSFLTTSFQQLRPKRATAARSATNKPHRKVPLTQRPELIAGIVLFASMAAIALYRLPTAPPLPLRELYIAWAIFIALTLVAALAIQREIDCVEWAQVANKEMKIMVTLPDSRAVINGKTRNFPQLPLELEFAKALPPPVTVDQSLNLSIFLGYREFVFNCRVTSLQGMAAEVTLHSGQLAEYKLLSTLVFSRHADWPMWLPPTHADRLLPGWLARILLRAQDAFYNLTVKSAMPAALQRLRIWLKLGNPTNG
jgi:cellulose synthase (UDP-forming)